MNDREIRRRNVDVRGLDIHYRELGGGPPVLLIHGWPTSSFLWRNIMPYIATGRRVIAIDLPGFGDSDKPTDRVYDLDFYVHVLSGFVDAVGIDEALGLAVHDLGGPVGLHWASQNDERIEKLAILNTLAYPQISWAARAFLWACKTPGFRSMVTTSWSLSMTMKFGVADKKRLADEVIAKYQAPFGDKASRKALALTASSIDGADLEGLANWLPQVTVPVQIVYGKRDRILPDIEHTVDKLRSDIPDADVVALDDCGHFLQEERPDEIGRILAGFFGA